MFYYLICFTLLGCGLISCTPDITGFENAEEDEGFYYARVLQKSDTVSIFDSLNVGFEAYASTSCTLKISSHDDYCSLMVFSDTLKEDFAFYSGADEGFRFFVFSLRKNGRLDLDTFSLLILKDSPVMKEYGDKTVVENEPLLIKAGYTDLFGYADSAFFVIRGGPGNPQPAVEEKAVFITINDTCLIKSSSCSVSVVFPYNGMYDASMYVKDDDANYSDTLEFKVYCQEKLQKPLITYPEDGSDGISINPVVKWMYPGKEDSEAGFFCRIFSDSSDTIISSPDIEFTPGLLVFSSDYQIYAAAFSEDDTLYSDTVFFSTEAQEKFPPSVPIQLCEYENCLDTTPVILNWKASIDSEEDSVYYILELRESGNSGFDEYFVSDTFFTVSSLQFGKEYLWQVRAADSDGMVSETSEQRSFFICNPPDAPPEPCEIDTVFYRNADTVEVRIERSKEADWDNYVLYISRDSVFLPGDSLISKDTHPFDTVFYILDNILSENTVYYIGSAVSDLGGSTGFSTAAGFVSDNNFPFRCLMKEAVNIEDSSATVSWVKSEVEDFSFYEVYLGKNLDSAYALKKTILDKEQNYHDMKELLPGKEYSTFVTVTDEGGLSSFSDTLVFETKLNLPSKPDLKVKDITENSAVLYWDEEKSPYISEYRIYTSTTGSPEPDSLIYEAGPGVDTEYLIENLIEYCDYRFICMAIDSFNNEYLSANLDIRTLPPAGMKLIPPGEFSMGYAEGYSSNQPPHRVKLSSFWMDSVEVTVDNFTGFGGVLPGDLSCGNCPVDSINMYKAMLYCNERSKAYGLDTVYKYVGMEVFNNAEAVLFNCEKLLDASGFRLPTEAEWEYAYRAGEYFKQYIWGDSRQDMTSYCWCPENSEGALHETGNFSPNGYGLYDMAGNALEMCGDLFEENYYTKSDTINPDNYKMCIFECPYVCRGGSVISYGEEHSYWYRNNTQVSLKAKKYTGFRCVRNRRNRRSK